MASDKKPKSEMTLLELVKTYGDECSAGTRRMEELQAVGNDPEYWDLVKAQGATLDMIEAKIGADKETFGRLAAEAERLRQEKTGLEEDLRRTQQDLSSARRSARGACAWGG